MYPRDFLDFVRALVTFKRKNEDCDRPADPDTFTNFCRDLMEFKRVNEAKVRHVARYLADPRPSLPPERLARAIDDLARATASLQVQAEVEAATVSAYSIDSPLDGALQMFLREAASPPLAGSEALLQEYRMEIMARIIRDLDARGKLHLPNSTGQ